MLLEMSEQADGGQTPWSILKHDFIWQLKISERNLDSAMLIAGATRLIVKGRREG